MISLISAITKSYVVLLVSCWFRHDIKNKWYTEYEQCEYNYLWKEVNTLHAAIGFTIHTQSFCFSKFSTFPTFLKTDTRHLCTYLKAFPIVISNIVTKFQNFWNFCAIFNCSLHMPAAWQVLSWKVSANLTRLLVHTHFRTGDTLRPDIDGLF